MLFYLLQIKMVMLHFVIETSKWKKIEEIDHP